MNNSPEALQNIARNMDAGKITELMMPAKKGSVIRYLQNSEQYRSVTNATEGGLKNGNEKGRKQMLVLNLKREWFQKIKSGEKTHEFREVKPYWQKRLYNNPSGWICFCDGYPKREDCYRRLYAQVVNITVRNGKDTDLKIDKDVFDIEFKLKAWR